MKTTARIVTLDEACKHWLDEWRTLEQHALQPNVSLSPHFVLAAARWLTPEQAPMCAVVTTTGRSGSEELRGLALLRPYRSWLVPLSSMALYDTPHTFANGVLIAEQEPERTAEALLLMLRREVPALHAWMLGTVHGEQPAFRMLHSVASGLGIRWYERRRFDRGTYQRPIPPLPCGAQRAAPKDVARHWRRLVRDGRAEHRIVAGTDVDAACIERHLELEHMGWKAARGASMLSRPRDAGFFRELCLDLAGTGRILFSELWADGRPISSASNFASQGRMFAFKLGWDPKYARYGVGVINEQLLLDYVTSRSDIAVYDSGTGEPCFIDRIFPDRSPVVMGFFALSRPGDLYLRLAANAWQIKDGLSPRVA